MNRAATPVDTKRKIYFESCGYCMNPACEVNFFENNCSEKAHIICVSDGGDNSEENLILLCANCHTKFDNNTSGFDSYNIKKWKRERRIILTNLFSKTAPNFKTLKEHIVPLLIRNQNIFENYGPHTNDTHLLWKKFEFEIIANNRKIELLLSKNKQLLHEQNQKIIDNFIQHSHEFIKTREDTATIRKNLFPNDILSIFGLGEVSDGIITNVSALQNLISFLQKEKRYIDLDLMADPPILIYTDEVGATINLKLTDTPKVNQIFFSGRLYQPKNNSLRLEGFIFLLKWLDDKNIQFKFDNFPDLSRLVLNKEYSVKLFYEYIVSVSCLYNHEHENLICVNLHNWNGGPYSEDATKYAKQFNMKLFNQTDFFGFAHRNIKNIK